MHSLGFRSLRHTSLARCLLMKHGRRTTLAPLGCRRQRIVDNRLGFVQDAVQMIRSPEALRINVVGILGSWRTSREPPV
jgi:hypothetical protein